MKNPNTPASRMKRGLVERWSSEDYPGAEPRFQITLLAKDIVIFVLLPDASFMASLHRLVPPVKLRVFGITEAFSESQ